QIEQTIRLVRGQRVLLDEDLARLYGVTTAALNQAVKRNAGRFPSDFAFQLSQEEFTGLISQIVISKRRRGGGANSLGPSRSTASRCFPASFTPAWQRE